MNEPDARKRAVSSTAPLKRRSPASPAPIQPLTLTKLQCQPPGAPLSTPSTSSTSQSVDLHRLLVEAWRADSEPVRRLPQSEQALRARYPPLPEIDGTRCSCWSAKQA